MLGEAVRDKIGGTDGSLRIILHINRKFKLRNSIFEEKHLFLLLVFFQFY